MWFRVHIFSFVCAVLRVSPAIAIEMKCGRLVILILTMNVVQAKYFQCKDYHIETGSCTITDVEPEDYVYLERIRDGRRWTIRNLTILNSTMDDLPSISPDLYHLSCIGCGLADIKEHSFTSVYELDSLNISFGSYRKLQKNLFRQLPFLTQLNVSHGAITEIDEAAFSGVEELEVLDLSHNNISKITSNMFAPLGELWMLNLSYNSLQIIDNALFLNKDKLNYLDLSHNNIWRVDGNRLLFNTSIIVSTVILSYNKLTTFETRNVANVWVDHNRIKQLHIMSSVQLMNADSNEIEKLICDENATQITSLDLTNNSLKELGCVGSLTQLTTLCLDQNDLGKLNQSTFAALSELTTLSLKSTNIGELEFGIFSHQNKLQFLDISFNRMGNISLDTFLGARNLESLFIDGNNITEFAYNDLKTAFTNFERISIGDNDFNCTFLAQSIKQLNSHNISTIGFYGNKVTDSHNINGIRCKDIKDSSTTAWIPSVISTDNGTTDAINNKVNVRLDADIQPVEKMSQILTENDKKREKISKDITIKHQNFKTNTDVKTEVLKITNSTSSSKAMWKQINQRNNITLEKQQISSGVQAQEINEIKFEIEKNSHKLSDIASKMEKLMKEVTVQQSSSTLGASDQPKDSSSSNFELIKNVNIILITLIVAFSIYKGYKFVRNDLPRVGRYNTANTLHTNIEMDKNS